MFLRKGLNFRTKNREVLTLIALKMIWLAAWFIFELMGVGVAPHVCEPQAFTDQWSSG